MLYQDKSWLYRKYIREKLSTVEIARLFREEEGKWCDPNTISRWLKKHEINLRSLNEAQQNRHDQQKAHKKKGSGKSYR